ncbi:glycosyltransferase family 2 protein [Enterobacter wuhouensis]|uniref:Glycosyltransferase n=1 Tax=Enterobacter wuhouensis TaxID=2529381 RepID=A0A4R0G7N5_9ENTR|nr:glycosyltransferase [Enterobacter wuhouensis]TCB90921.1 glycosyltransferase [Enterobacter wuhouensis]WRW30019.1 glycosyltransferase [Enterobacter wuhouensis]
MPDISFIIPVYNVSSYIKDFFKPFKLCTISCEVIFVNDGSTDSSADILQQLENEDSRVTVIHKQNGGVSSARNLGIKLATGRFISCLDPDDLVSPSLFKCIDFSLREFQDVDTIVYRYEKFNDGEKPKVFSNDVGHSAYNYIHKNKLSTLHNYPWQRIVKREFYLDNFFPEGIIYEDSVTIPILNAKARVVLEIDVVLYYYRVRKDSLTNFNIQKNMELVTALSLLEDKVAMQPDYRQNLYSCVAHLSRSALVILTKMSKSNSSVAIFKNNHRIIFSKFSRYPLSVILSSNASPIDRFCFVLLKMHLVGFLCFKLIYKIISK